MSEAEFRSIDNPLEKLKEARSHIDALITEMSPPSGQMSLAEALAIVEGRA
jgi:hypothetical protein